MGRRWALRISLVRFALVLAFPALAFIASTEALTVDARAQDAAFRPTPEPSLTLEPSSGPPGTPVVATVSGYHCSQVVVLWDGKEPLGQPGAVQGGTATVEFTVPDNAAVADHDVVAQCAGDGQQSAPVPFSVTPAPTLELDTTSGPPGTHVVATASGYDCSEVVVLWDGKEPLGQPGAVQDGTATVEFDVPGDAAVADHDVVAQCAGDGQESAPVSFTVEQGTTDTGTTGTEGGGAQPGSTATGTTGTQGGGAQPGSTDTGTSGAKHVEPTGTASQSTPWWLIAVAAAILLILALLAFRVVRARRMRRWIRAHVRVVPEAATRRRLELAEAPTERSAPTVAVRITAHAGSGTQLVEEVDQ